MLLTSLSDNASVTLPDDLLWIDEHSWTPPVATVSYLLTGALLVESSFRQAGRPITLVGTSDMGWITRKVVNTLYDWASKPQKNLDLNLFDGRDFTVTFRHNEAPLEVEPILGFPSKTDRDFYRTTIRLCIV